MLGNASAPICDMGIRLRIRSRLVKVGSCRTAFQDMQASENSVETAVRHRVAGPSVLIRVSNFLELAVAAAIKLFRFH